MNLKGNITVSDRIDFDIANRIAIELLKSHKKTNKKLGFYICLILTTGLRISDALTLTHEAIEKGYYELREKKTSKAKRYDFSLSLIAIYNKYYLKGEGLLFANNSGTKAISNSFINRKLKEIFHNSDLNISSHSLRKAFGYNLYQLSSNKTEALYQLSEIYNHSSPKTTKIYIGVRTEELQEVINKNILRF
ncbi:tyrosine-type recombinase/integrase [Marinifilum fragile]|uniref:tyrosine-type recombinase/integrase n=1 Tax=Marinifilum fragile TaxID=570161 RepID=UPI002AA90787|nr:tyrosine-type recombinase/integrase [Marinifilum fragile]